MKVISIPGKGSKIIGSKHHVNAGDAACVISIPGQPIYVLTQQLLDEMFKEEDPRLVLENYEKKLEYYEDEKSI